MIVNPPNIVGLVLVKDEDLYVRTVVQNMLEFCDSLIILDNGSSDGTYSILQELAALHSKINLRQITSLADSHKAIEQFAGTPTWLFAVDGDEIYDAGGLARLRPELQSGKYNDYWHLYGHVLNCTEIDPVGKVAEGYMAPPARSMTKLYNFSAIESWIGCLQRLHGGDLRFKPGYDSQRTYAFFHNCSWEESCFRCLHMVFLRRSTRTLTRRMHLCPVDAIRKDRASSRLLGAILFLTRYWVACVFRTSGKDKAYRRGSRHKKDVSAFL